MLDGRMPDGSMVGDSYIRPSPRVRRGGGVRTSGGGRREGRGSGERIALAALTAVAEEVVVPSGEVHAVSGWEVMEAAKGL